MLVALQPESLHNMIPSSAINSSTCSGKKSNISPLSPPPSLSQKKTSCSGSLFVFVFVFVCVFVCLCVCGLGIKEVYCDGDDYLSFCLSTCLSISTQTYISGLTHSQSFLASFIPGRSKYNKDKCMFLLYIHANSVNNNKGNTSSSDPCSGLSMEFSIKVSLFSNSQSKNNKYPELK